MNGDNFSEAALVVLGHGTTQNDGSAAPVYQHAAELRRRKIFAEVREAFWKQEPQIKKVLPEISASRVFIVPLFISEGYFSDEVIPRELGFGELSTLNTPASEASERRRINSLPGQSGATTGQPSTGFDRVLVDAPCSNTGVMRRRVDLRWRIQPEEIERLRTAQLDLLQQAATQVKPGGVLVYSTCSLEPEENGEVVKQFLNEHADFKLESERELLPFADQVDGAFVARLIHG